MVLTSSIAGVAPGAKDKISKNAYNEEYIKLAWDSSFDHPSKMFFCACCSGIVSREGSLEVCTGGEASLHSIYNPSLREARTPFDEWMGEGSSQRGFVYDLECPKRESKVIWEDLCRGNLIMQCLFIRSIL